MDRVPTSTWLFIVVPSFLTYIAAIYYYLKFNQ
jgi:hypothetical protein